MCIEVTQYLLRDLAGARSAVQLASPIVRGRPNPLEPDHANTVCIFPAGQAGGSTEVHAEQVTKFHDGDLGWTWDSR